MPLSKITRTRLTRLIVEMESLPAAADKHFNMRYWNDLEKSTLRKLMRDMSEGDTLRQEDLVSCGTKACSMGWASTIPYFKRLGITTKLIDGDLHLDVNGVTSHGSCWGDLFNEIAGVFDISKERAMVIFGPEGVDETPKAWAKRARHCMKIWAQQE